MFTIIVGWISFSFVTAIIAKNKGLDSFSYFLLSIFLSPLIGIILALVAKPDTKKIEEQKLSSGENKKCPYCAELIKVEAIVCRYCGRSLPLPQFLKCPSCSEDLELDEDEMVKRRFICSECNAEIDLTEKSSPAKVN